MKMKIKVKLGEHDLKDTHIPGETSGGPADMVRHMIRKIGVQAGGPKAAPKSIGVGKSKPLDKLESAVE
jgi:hypothetical protein